jgi:hypothetical protein
MPGGVKKADDLQQLANGNSSKGFFAAIKQVYDPQKLLLRQLEMRMVHKCSQRNQQLCLGGGNISPTY